MSVFTGFSEEDLRRIKSGDDGEGRKLVNSSSNKVEDKKSSKLSLKTKPAYKYKSSSVLLKQDSDEAIDTTQFDKCKLSLKSPPSMLNESNNTIPDNSDSIGDVSELNNELKNEETNVIERRNSLTPDIVRGVENYTEHDTEAHKAKLEELQLRQKIMEEQNKKRKEMLAKALADRTKQTEEEVLKLEKIKKELQILDSQFSQDVAVLRKKIDHACLSYVDAEKHYLRVEKEFLQAKIQLQKEKEKKELLTEHLCALITHNETRKAQKLETLMLELADDKKNENNEIPVSTTDDDKPVIIDGVDEKTGKIVELDAKT